MESVLGIVQSPVFLGMLVFLGMASLLRILLARDPNLKRAYKGDRRRVSKMPAMPFEDSDGVLVTEDRRLKVDRRQHRILAMQGDIDEDGAAG